MKQFTITLNDAQEKKLDKLLEREGRLVDAKNFKS